VVHDDLLRAITKINPIATWTDDDVATYTAMHELPPHPLTDRGYPSIGCWPCTRPATADDPRAGRWAGTGKTECGLHSSTTAVFVDERRR
jgi:phosphoadenosine phosphosulfate reductase